MGVKKEGYLLS